MVECGGMLGDSGEKGGVMTLVVTQITAGRVHLYECCAFLDRLCQRMYAQDVSVDGHHAFTCTCICSTLLSSNATRRSNEFSDRSALPLRDENPPTTLAAEDELSFTEA